MHLAMGRAKHRKKHGKAAQALQQPGEAARAAAAGQQVASTACMPCIMLCQSCGSHHIAQAQSLWFEQPGG